MYNSRYGTGARRLGYFGATDPEDTTVMVTDADDTPWYMRLGDLATQVFAAKTQYDINEINLDRIRAGQTPISQDVIAATAPRVNVGVAPDQLQKIMIYGGIALAAIVLIPMLTKR